MIISLVTIAFNSLVLLIAPFAILGIYILSCLILRRQISNTLLSITAMLAILVATLHFSVTYLLPSMGPVAMLYFGTTALVLAGALVENPVQKVRAGILCVKDWLRTEAHES